MKTKYDGYEWVVVEGEERYQETDSAQPTSRVLEGSRDHGYYAEYVGHGTIDGMPVKAIYLFDEDDMQNEDGELIEDEGDLDWDNALKNGRLVVLVDQLTDDQYRQLQKEATI